MKLSSNSFPDNGPIPSTFAFGQPGADAPFAVAPNRSPHLTWSDVPEGTRSFAIVCHDPDVPSVGDDVNQADRTVSAALPRVDFYHWVLIDVPSYVRELPEGADSDGVVGGGKSPGPTECGVRGLNNYTNWFAGDADMGGDYGGYDGPCPPWNDERLHHYVFTVYALDVETLDQPDLFGGPEALAAMEGHVLAKASWTGTYSMYGPTRAAHGIGSGGWVRD